MYYSYPICEIKQEKHICLYMYRKLLEHKKKYYLHVRNEIERYFFHYMLLCAILAFGHVFP